MEDLFTCGAEGSFLRQFFGYSVKKTASLFEPPGYKRVTVFLALGFETLRTFTPIV